MTLPSSSEHGARLACGGLFHTLLRKSGLARDREHDLRRQVIASVAIGWFPLLVLAGMEMLRGRAPDRLVFHASVHTRTLLAVPLWLVTERVVAWHCNRTLDRFLTEELANRHAVERITQSANRLRISWWPELLLFAAAVALGQLTLWRGESGILEGSRGDIPNRLSMLRIWYSVVSLPLFNFLFARTLWHWFIWTRLSSQLSRLRLRIMPTHPDGAGGIAFVFEPSVALALAVLTASSVLASVGADQILAGTSTFRQLTPPFVLLLLLSELIAIGPVLFFTRQLFLGRLQGLRQYGELAVLYTRGFHARWIDPGKGIDVAGRNLLGTPDIQSLADLAISHSIVERMRAVPVEKRGILIVALGVLIPMIPLAATEMPLQELFTRLGRALLGGLTK